VHSSKTFSSIQRRLSFSFLSFIGNQANNPRLLSIFRRGVNDVVHEFTAVGSRDVEKAKQWIKEKTGKDDHPAKAYGTYDEVVNDSVCSTLLASLTPLTW
jgi:hypothetical protein